MKGSFEFHVVLSNLQRSAIRGRHEESISYEKKKKFADTLLFLILQLTFGLNSIGCRSKLPCTTSNSQIFPTPMCQDLYWCEYSLILFSGLPKYHNRTGAYFGTRQFSKYVYSYFNLRCRIKASSLQDKTEGEYGILMNNYQQN